MHPGGTCASVGVSAFLLGWGDSVWEATEVLLMFRLLGRGAAATGCRGSAWLFVPQCFASVGSLSFLSSCAGAVPMSADARRSTVAGGCRPLISVGHRRLFILLLLAEPSLWSQSTASRKPRANNMGVICDDIFPFVRHLVVKEWDKSSKGAT